LDPVNVPAKFEIRIYYIALPVPEIIVIAVLGGGCEHPILGKRPQRREEKFPRLFNLIL